MMNVCVFSGRLSADPVVKEISTAKGPAKVANFSLAVRQISKDKENDTLWLNCSVFGKTAEFVGNYLKKGSIATVSGSLNQRSYEKDGQKKTVYELKVDNVDSPNIAGATSTAAPTDTAGNPVSVVEDDSIPF